MKKIELDESCGLDAIRHSGIIKKIDDDFIYVSIVSQSACAECHAKGACNITDLNEEIVEVPRNGDESRKIGDRVQVAMHKSLGTRAVMLGYLIPFILVIITLVSVLSLGGSEGLAGLLSIGMLLPYYIILHYARKHLKKTFAFNIQ